MRSIRDAQPILILIGLVAVLLALTIVTREISAHAGFLVERQAVLAVWLSGLVIAAVIFATMVRRSIRRANSTSSRLLLVATALALASPLALMLLQHPAP
jgi:uncharacterized membrane protein